MNSEERLELATKVRKLIRGAAYVRLRSHQEAIFVGVITDLILSGKLSLGDASDEQA